MSPSLFTMDPNPTAALPTLESLIAQKVDSSDSDTASESSYGSEYIAPLSGHVLAPSIDGTTVGVHGLRAEKAEDVTPEDKAVRPFHLAGSCGLSSAPIQLGRSITFESQCDTGRSLI